MISINGLKFAYRKQQPLFENLSLNLTQGGIVGLLGKNGAGKTSLLKILCGLSFAKGGECSVLGFNPRERRVEMLADLYFLPEDLYVPGVDAQTYASLYAQFYPRFDNTLYQKALKEFEVPANQKLTKLSHGQKKKAMLAFALATQTSLLILDEPTNGFDIPSKAQFRKLLAEHYQENRLIIISTHQVHDIEKMLDTIVMIHDGKILLQQTLASIMSRLSFKRMATAPVIGSYIHMEPHFGGYAVLQHNTEGGETEIDLELLFNAILQQPNAIQAAFTQGK